jgi:hypothetical protein
VGDPDSASQGPGQSDSITWPHSLQESRAAPLEATKKAGETAGKSWENVVLWLSLNIDKTMLYDFHSGMSDRSQTTPQTTPQTNPPPAPVLTPEEASERLLNDALFAPIRDIVATAGITPPMRNR